MGSHADNPSQILVSRFARLEAHRRSDLKTIVDGFVDDRGHHGSSTVRHTQQVLPALHLFARRDQNLADASGTRSNNISLGEKGVASLLLSERTRQAK